MATFASYFTDTVWPVINTDFTRLQTTGCVKRKQGGVGRPYEWGKLTASFTPTVRSQRNITGNLTWTPPSQNTVLQKNLVKSVVENFAMDAYLHVAAPAAASAAPAAASAALAAASAALSEEAAAAEGGDLIEADGPNVALLKTQKRIFNIPNQVPAEYAIPICLRSNAEPVKGKWERMGGDIAVQGTWLAYYWAIQDGDVHAKEAIEHLVLNWPFDLYLYEEGAVDADANLITNVDASILTKVINLPLSVERARDYFGMDGGNLLAVVREAKEMVKSLGLVSPAARDLSQPVFAWLTDPKFRWGVFRTPTLRTVKDLLRTDERVQRYPEVLEIMNLCRAAFGRDNFWDQTGKVSMIASSTSVPLDYVARWIYVQMMRKTRRTRSRRRISKAQAGSSRN